MSKTLARPLLFLNYSLVAVIFALNFLGIPALKWVYPVAALAALVTVASFELAITLPLLLTWCFLEGQARVVWSYHPVFRLLFDILVGAAILRTLLARRRVDVQNLLPRPLLILLLLHVLWYGVEVLNPNAVSYFAPVAATKIYIFPFLMFWMFRMNPEAFGVENLARLTRAALVLVALEALLSLYQLSAGDGLVRSISPSYLAAMKTDVFVGVDFRPFGTMFAPGVVGVYLFLSAGLLFLRDRFSKRAVVLISLLLVLLGVTILGSQVRSALVKYLLLLAAAAGILFFTSPPPRLRRPFLALLTLFAAGALALAVGRPPSGDAAVSIERGLERWKMIDSFEAFKARRAGPGMALVIARGRLAEFPLGLGPGVTGAASSVSREALDRDPLYDRETFWGYDNLFLSLVVEFGYGAVFYALLVLGVPLVLLRRAVRLLRAGDRYRCRVTAIAFTQLSIILLGNWGAIGLPYNPESFFFWLWAAVGLNVSTTDVSA